MDFSNFLDFLLGQEAFSAVELVNSFGLLGKLELFWLVISAFLALCQLPLLYLNSFVIIIISRHP